MSIELKIKEFVYPTFEQSELANNLLWKVFGMNHIKFEQNIYSWFYNKLDDYDGFSGHWYHANHAYMLVTQDEHLVGIGDPGSQQIVEVPMRVASVIASIVVCCGMRDKAYSAGDHGTAVVFDAAYEVNKEIALELMDFTDDQKSLLLNILD